MAQYQFPQMSLDEAVESFATDPKLRSITGSALTHADFRKPDPQRWQQIYGAFLELLTSVPCDSIRQEVIHLGMQCPSLEHAEICDEAVHLCLFSLYMGRLLGTCGFTDFGIKDIARPTTKRLLMIVSALINFYKFQAGRLEVYEEMKDTRMRENEHYVQLVTANDELRQKINNIKAKQAEKEPKVLQLQNENRELSSKMGENRKVETGIRASLAEQKAKIAENEAANDQLRVKILENKKLCEKVSRQIVHSPTRLKEDRKRTQEHLSHLRQSSGQRMQRMLELREQLERLRMVEEMEQPQKLLRAIQAEEEKEKECSLEAARIRDEITSLEEAFQSECGREQETNTVIAAKQEKMTKLALQHQHKMAGARATNDQLAQQVEMAKGENCEKKDQIRAVYQQKRGRLDKLLASIEDKENDMELMKSAYAESLEKLEGYHNKLAAAWERGQIKLQSL